MLRLGGSLRTILGAAYLGAALVAVPVAGPAHAAFPDKPIRFVVPFPAGGGNEITARALAEGMTKDLGQQVVIDIKPGAGTIVGTEYALTRPADGYTILMASFSHTVNPSLQPSLPYDPAKVGYVALIGRFANSVVIPLDRPFKTMPELIAHARANPGKLQYGSFGTGTSPHLFPEMLKAMAKLDIQHVPYKGGAPAMVDLLGGRLDMIFSTSASAAGHVRNNKLLLIAVTSEKRSSFYPNVPTVAESGVPGYDAVAWYGVLAPFGTPPDIVARLSKAVQASAQSEYFRKRAQEDGIDLDIGGPEALATFMQAQEARWRKVVKDGGIKPE